MPAEREFVMNIMMLASADQKDRHGIFWKLDQAAKYPFEFLFDHLVLHE